MNLIYIADDSADQRLLLNYFLRRINPQYTILNFSDGKALLDKLVHVIDDDDPLPFLVFLDYEMPDLGGYQTLKKILLLKSQNLLHSTTVQVVIYSAYSEQHLKQRCIDAGAFAFLEKPANLEELERLLMVAASNS